MVTGAKPEVDGAGSTGNRDILPAGGWFSSDGGRAALAPQGEALAARPYQYRAFYAGYSFALSGMVNKTFRAGTLSFNKAISSKPVVSGNAIWPPSAADR